MELELLKMLAETVPGMALVLAILGTLVVVGQVVVVLTPSQNDDMAWERIKGIPILGNLIAALAAFAPVQKK